jgi:hypothetical protein
VSDGHSSVTIEGDDWGGGVAIPTSSTSTTTRTQEKSRSQSEHKSQKEMFLHFLSFLDLIPKQ